MFDSAQLLFEFETKQKGAIRHLRLLHFANHFWLQSQNSEDWLAIIEDIGGQMELAWKLGTPTGLRQRAEVALEVHRFGRALEWHDGNNEWLLLWKSRQHAWMNPHGEAVLFESKSDWHKGPLWTQPNDYFHQRFEQEWQVPDCDARDALAFLQATEDERSRWGIEWKRGSWEEVQRVIRAAMHVEFNRAARLTQIASDYQGEFCRWICEDALVPSRLKPLLKIMDERNIRSEKPHSTPHFIQHPQFYFAARRPHIAGNKRRLHVTTLAPSMHEKIEARIFLLDWLGQHAPQLLPDWQ